jgi:hypothetical protein
MLSRWAAARHSLGNWLSSQGPHLPVQQRKIATAWSQCSEAAASEIEPLCIASAEFSGVDDARLRGIATAIARVADREKTLIETLRSIARPIFIRPAYEAAPLSI